MTEFMHIFWLTKKYGSAEGEIIKSIGDDCAVIDAEKSYQLFTTDMLVESDHFRHEWSSPKQIGKKAMAINISDIAAMGGIPKYVLISLCLSGKEPKDFFKKFYEGVEERCNHKNYRIKIIGGNITHGAITVINVALIGEVEKERCVFRSGAKKGDLIGVTGYLGASWAGLEYLRQNYVVGADLRPLRSSQNYCLKKHLEPEARIPAGRILSKYVTAMIDVSDGLGSEVRHIAEASKLGAKVFQEKIPLRNEVKKMGEFLKKDPYFWALSGGEDFELVFTISKDNLKKLEKENLDFTIVGEMTGEKKCWLIDEKGNKKKLPGGYEHRV